MRCEFVGGPDGSAVLTATNPNELGAVVLHAPLESSSSSSQSSFIVYNLRQVGHMHKRDREVEGGKKKRKRAFECVVSLLAVVASPGTLRRAMTVQALRTFKVRRSLSHIRIASLAAAERGISRRGW